MCLIKKITSEIIHLIIRMHSVNSEGHYQQHCFHESGKGPGHVSMVKVVYHLHVLNRSVHGLG